MASSYPSAGVYTKETDISQGTAAFATATGAVVGASNQGSLVKQLMTSPQEFLAEYGTPDASVSFFHYTALTFLAQGNALWCQRVVKNALFGGVVIKKSTTNVAFSVGRANTTFQLDSAYTNPLFYIFAKDPGVWNNGLGIQIANLDAVALTFDIIVFQKDSTGTYVQKEKFTVSRKAQVDGNGRQIYLETRINGFSSYIVVADNTAELNTVMPIIQSTTLAMAGGDNGAVVTSAEVDAGWDNFANPSDVDVSLLLNGGYTDITIQTKIKTIAEARKDCFAILDMDYASLVSVAAQVTWRKTTQNFNSSYCGLFSGWLNFYDQYNDIQVMIPPSGPVGAQYAYNDFVGYPWTAAAGSNRGMLNVLGVSNIYTQGDRDLLAQNQINVIQYFPGQGIQIYDELTEQSATSALSNIHVRRELIVIEKTLSIALRPFLFEPNNQFTRFRAKAVADQYLNLLSSQGAFQTELGDKGFLVVCDTTNNTPAVIDLNQMNMDAFVKPIRVARAIQLQMIITSSGASFNEIMANGISL